jgi:hypothetical protein
MLEPLADVPKSRSSSALAADHLKTRPPGSGDRVLPGEAGSGKPICSAGYGLDSDFSDE